MRLNYRNLGIIRGYLIYGAFYKHDEPLKMMRYLYDGIDKDSIEIDTINFSSLFSKK